MVELLRRWQNDLLSGEISPPEIACDFVLWHGARKHGAFWLGSTKPGWKPTAVNVSVLGDLAYLDLPTSTRARQSLASLKDRIGLLEAFQLKGVREDSHQGLLGWLKGDFPLKARLDRPTPLVMLDLQCAGERCATLHLEPEEQFTAIGRHAGAYEFLLHDLEHAAKFFGSTYQGQVQFFNQVRKAFYSGLFRRWWTDSLFRTDFEYLISDMNSHPVHLMKYLKAIWLEALRREEGSGESLESHWNDLLERWEMPLHVSEAARRLNQPEMEREDDRLSISQYFLESHYGS